jgi:ATP-dependent HslUV protease ATP-binding subunit HslU
MENIGARRLHTVMTTQLEETLFDLPDVGDRKIVVNAAVVNSRMENIGARRLHTVLTTQLEETLFELPDSGAKKIVVNADAVREKLKSIVEDEDLRKYIL